MRESTETKKITMASEIRDCTKHILVLQIHSISQIKILTTMGLTMLPFEALDSGRITQDGIVTQ